MEDVQYQLNTSSLQERRMVEFQRISLTGFRSCTSRSHYRSVSKQTTRTGYQLANIFTTPLARKRLEFLIKKLGMQSMSPETLKKLADKEEE
ncbi:hypothetical protein Tco_0559360 [Tanacetum coccineum]